MSLVRAIGSVRVTFIRVLVSTSEHAESKYSQRYLVSIFVNHNDFDRTARLWIAGTAIDPTKFPSNL